MKKVILTFLFLGFFVFLICRPVYSQNFFREILEPLGLAEEKEEEDFNIFSDSVYTKPTHNFSPGQMVYVKVEAPVSGDREKTLLLLDSEKKEIRRLALAHSGSGPYIFTSSFAAPKAPGVYYVDIKIRDGQGSVFSSQENINIGENHISGPVLSEAESRVDQVEQVSPTTVPTTTPTPIPIPKRITPVSFVFKIIQFVRRLLSTLTEHFE